MAIGTPTIIAAARDSVAVTTFDITVPAGGVPQGALVVIAVGLSENGSAHSCTDDQSNSYDIDRTDASHADGNLETVFFSATDIGTALAEDDSITVSWTGTAEWGYVAGYVTGIATSGALDQNAGAEGAETGDTVNSGNITTLVADSVIFGCVTYDAASSRTITEDANFTLLGNIGGGDGRQSHLAYRVVSATETMNYHPTGFGASDEWHAFILNYKAEAVSALPFKLVGPGGLAGPGGIVNPGGLA